MQGRVALRGVGVLLPGPEGGRGHIRTREELWEVVRDGRCCLCTRSYFDLPERPYGVVHGFDAESSLEIPARHLRKYSRAAVLALASFKHALLDAGLTAPALSNDRTLLVLCSVQHAAGHFEQYYRCWQQDGMAGLKLDYLIGGMPVSIENLLCNTFGVSARTFSLNGGCNVAAKGLELALGFLSAGMVDRAAIVGFDVAIDKLIFSCAYNQGRLAPSLAALAREPQEIRIHDRRSQGQAVGEGAITLLLERQDADRDEPGFVVRSESERLSGDSPMAPGDGSNYVRASRRTLDGAGIGLANVAFVNDMGEGSTLVQGFSYHVVRALRDHYRYAERLHLTNQEACFGHIGGVSSALKIAANMLMMDNEVIGPCVNCVEPALGIPMTPVLAPTALRSRAEHSLVLCGGVGGDGTTVLLSRAGA